MDEECCRVNKGLLGKRRDIGCRRDEIGMGWGQRSMKGCLDHGVIIFHLDAYFHFLQWKSNNPFFAFCIRLHIVLGRSNSSLSKDSEADTG